MAAATCATGAAVACVAAGTLKEGTLKEDISQAQTENKSLVDDDGIHGVVKHVKHVKHHDVHPIDDPIEVVIPVGDNGGVDASPVKDDKKTARDDNKRRAKKKKSGLSRFNTKNWPRQWWKLYVVKTYDDEGDDDNQDREPEYLGWYNVSATMYDYFHRISSRKRLPAIFDWNRSPECIKTICHMGGDEDGILIVPGRWYGEPTMYADRNVKKFYRDSVRPALCVASFLVYEYDPRKEKEPTPFVSIVVPCHS